MKSALAIAGLAASILVNLQLAVVAEPVLMLNEPRDVKSAEYSCNWAKDQLKANEYLVRNFQCGEDELCKRAMDINATCKASGPASEVRGFHSKLLAQFASEPQCSISIMRLSDGKTDAGVKNDLEAFKRQDWELVFGFTPGASVQEWSMWPREPGPYLEGSGTIKEVVRRVCSIMTRSGAKILN